MWYASWNVAAVESLNLQISWSNSSPVCIVLGPINTLHSCVTVLTIIVRELWNFLWVTIRNVSFWVSPSFSTKINSIVSHLSRSSVSPLSSHPKVLLDDWSLFRASLVISGELCHRCRFIWIRRIVLRSDSCWIWSILASQVAGPSVDLFVFLDLSWFLPVPCFSILAWKHPNASIYLPWLLTSRGDCWLSSWSHFCPKRTIRDAGLRRIGWGRSSTCGSFSKLFYSYITQDHIENHQHKRFMFGIGIDASTA